MRCAELPYVPKSSVPLEVAIFTEDNRSEIQYRIGFKEDEPFVLLIDAAITFINTCHISRSQLDSVPKDLLKPFRAYMKILWKTTRTQILFGNSITFYQQKLFCSSNIMTDNLAESVFRLSINADKITPSVSLDVVKRSIFGPDQSSLENFILNCWEDSPLLMRGSLEVSDDRNSVLSLLRECLCFNNEGPPNISALLKNLISCPPLASDELVILNFLNEVRGHLGSPMIYQQDMRVLRTPHLNGETHFFKGSRVLHMDDILRCEEAFKDGYTIALRGMEFRFETIADIVDGLVNLFGQPSAGANMYLTPSNSQGLARHYDDHCVFVCQLSGAKKWKVFPRLSLLLPRLYDPVDSLDKTDGVSNECNEFLLREGDILYIPRGFLHEASTILENAKPEEEVEFSLHLTLAIEVEAPFEWEGFAHIALYSWFQSRQQCFNSSQASIYHGLNVISINLLHVAIKLIGANDPTFRKACLVGAISLLSDGKKRLYQNQKTIFSHLINTIAIKSSCSDAIEIVASSLGNNEDPFQKLRWLQNLEDDHEIFELKNWMIAPAERENSFVFICNELKEKVEASFMFVKSKFCNEVDFEESEKCYSGLLEKYKKVRKQYINGMLSLHCN